MILKKTFLRGRQFIRSWQAKPLGEFEMDYLKSVLTPAQFSLFIALPLYEQRHALNVCRTLTSAGYGYDLELLQASLLHDLGKFDPTTGQAIPIWVKVVNVAANTVAGSLYQPWRERQGQARPSELRYYFWLQAAHEERGAALVREAGGSSRVAALVGQGKRLQQQGDRAAQALCWADDLN
jgi:hypothetical protein